MLNVEDIKAQMDALAQNYRDGVICKETFTNAMNALGDRVMAFIIAMPINSKGEG